MDRIWAKLKWLCPIESNVEATRNITSISNWLRRTWNSNCVCAMNGIFVWIRYSSEPLSQFVQMRETLTGIRSSEIIPHKRWSGSNDQQQRFMVELEFHRGHKCFSMAISHFTITILIHIKNSIFVECPSRLFFLLMVVVVVARPRRMKRCSIIGKKTKFEIYIVLCTPDAAQ